MLGDSGVGFVASTAFRWIFMAGWPFWMSYIHTYICISFRLQGRISFIPKTAPDRDLTV